MLCCGHCLVREQQSDPPLWGQKLHLICCLEWIRLFVDINSRYLRHFSPVVHIFLLLMWWYDVLHHHGKLLIMRWGKHILEQPRDMILGSFLTYRALNDRFLLWLYCGALALWSDIHGEFPKVQGRHKVRSRLQIYGRDIQSWVATLTVKSYITFTLHILVLCWLVVWLSLSRSIFCRIINQLISSIPVCKSSSRDGFDYRLKYLVNREPFFMQLKNQIHQFAFLVPSIAIGIQYIFKAVGGTYSKWEFNRLFSSIS